MIESAKEDGLLVACLCATWCKTCTEFRTTFDKLAAADPAVKSVCNDRDAAAVPEEIAGLPAALSARL